MSMEINPKNQGHLFDKNQELQRELELALETIKRYEIIIADLQSENNHNLKKFTHDLANPLQIISMTIESLQERNPEFAGTLERMKRSTDNMIAIIASIRSLRQNSLNLSPSLPVKDV